ncbi:hypothetical protein LCGC14_2001920 [marine sediment metagenome]|uniref:Uncharacterized protein n=1 Tax=marine sediment metagenome TaxID=412755 RepID=A0A0F9HGD8_9ZZZZ|nr:hypothetical protein [bacterium]
MVIPDSTTISAPIPIQSTPADPNQLYLRVEDIQYLPFHSCPVCRAAPVTTGSGDWVKPYQDWYNTPLSNWLDHLGYIRFACDCRHHSDFIGDLRIVRLCDAVIPLRFDHGTLARNANVTPAEYNADRVRQAVTFLLNHADPAKTQSTDFLTHTLYALAAGGISPDAAIRELRQWKNDHQEALT